MYLEFLAWEFSLQRVFLYTHGHALLEFVQLSDGIALGLIRRWEIVISRSRKTTASDPRV